jgi:hypothetical protein
MIKRFFAVLTALALGAVLGACGDSKQVIMVGEPQPVHLEQHENYRDFGDYVIHFNALNTSDLPAEVARAYGIKRSDSRALLNVVILKEKEGTTGVPVTGSVAVTATNLTGQLKTITMREVVEEDGSGIYYLGETSVTHRETLIYTIDVTPINEKSRFSAIYKKEFFTD